MALQSLKDKKEIVVHDVVRSGEQILIPESCTYEEAIRLLKERAVYENTLMEISRTYAVFPWDGALALQMVFEEKFGYAQGKTIPGGFFEPDQPPQMISAEVGYGKTRQVPWGRFGLIGIDGWIETGFTRAGRSFVFMLNAQVKRKHERQVEEIFQAVNVHLMNNSIYRGKPVRVRFKDEQGRALPLPELKFLDTKQTNTQDAVYSRMIEAQLQTNLYTPITRSRDCLANKIPVKRGVLLGGVYGTGKTLAAAVAARLAEENGITYVYAPRADELADAIEFAKMYQSPACVVFCEDIDRSMKGDRSVKVDDILNTVDGIDSKSNNIIVVLTTNAVEDITPAMLRPGRLDSVIEVTPPDGEAVTRLIRVYGGAAIPPDADLSAAGEALKGQIPAVIAEVVKRAKLAQLGRQERGTFVTGLTQEALVESAQSMAAQIELLDRLSRAPKAPTPNLEQAMMDVVSKVINPGMVAKGVAKALDQ